MNEIKYPECTKLAGVADKSQEIGDFLDWLQEQGINLGTYHKHTEPACYQYGTVELKPGERKSWDFLGNAKYVGEKSLNCGCRDGEMVLIAENFEHLLARYFNVDLDKVEKERREILKNLQKEAPEG